MSMDKRERYRAMVPEREKERNGRERDEEREREERAWKSGDVRAATLGLLLLLPLLVRTFTALSEVSDGPSLASAPLALKA